MKLISRYFPVEIVSVFFILAAVSVIFTWPLVLHLRTAIPAGSEPAAVAYFQLFTAQWTGWNLGHPGSYWDAPFFYPFKGAFAWSEPQFFTAAVIALSTRVLGYIAAYNSIILLYMVLLGMAGYIGARMLTGDKVASLWSGIWMCAGAYPLQQLCAPALLAAWSVFFLILCSFWAVIKKRRFYYWLGVIFYIISWFTCKQLALMATLFLPFCLWPWIVPAKGRVRIGRCILYAVLGLGLAAMIVLPFALQQAALTRSMGFARSLSDTIAVLHPASLLMPAAGHWLMTSILKIDLYSWSISVVMAAVILAALSLGFGRSLYVIEGRRKIVIGLWSLVLVSFFMALGPDFGFYRVLFGSVPGFMYIRAPARNIVFAIFAVAILGAGAFAFIRNKAGKGLPVILVTGCAYIFLFAEMWTMPIPLAAPLQEIDGHWQVIDWLKEHDPQGAVIELPAGRGREMEAAAMLRMLEHKHPVIGGYCSFTPIPYVQLKKALETDPTGKGREYLSAYDARYVVVHRDREPLWDYSDILGDGDAVVFAEPSHVIVKRRQAVYIGKEDEFLPQKSDFGSKTPFAGKIYSLKLLSPVPEAALLDFSRPRKFAMIWKDAFGRREQAVLTVNGSVILDKGDQCLFFRLLAASGKNGQAQGVLVNK